ncbi:TatD family hydrolase [Gracilibacillus saliphilus]|uniref:TatD family hydrolase n=1 Tax=Gracilibacillus saliphilus TaxID=543890 RepID=UPI0013D5BDCA|nr:TatD family hydrolase [Gracilibacillus saliphilus]
MKIFDPHIHCYSRTTDDYQRMGAAGVRVVVEPSFWLGSDRQYAESYFDYFKHILTFEPTRAKQFGNIEHFSCIGMNPKEANNLEIAHEVIDGMGEYLEHERCLALGEIGFDLITDAEEEIMVRQLQMAKELDLLVMVHTPHTQKRKGTYKTCEILEQVGINKDKVILDHNNQDTMDIAVDYGAWSAMTIYPTKVLVDGALELLGKYGTDRMMINTAADWGPADPLNIANTALAMRKAGYSDEEIEKLVWDNPFNYYKQSGKLNLEKQQEVHSN